MAEYDQLLSKLLKYGYEFQSVANLSASCTGKTAYLRHDIDLHLEAIDHMAEVEARLGISATYYVLLTHTYNPLYRDNRAILYRLMDLGHEIGLHYDLETYPTDLVLAHRQLEWEIGLLEHLIGRAIHTIATHNVFKNQTDPFRLSDTHINPYNPAYHHNLTYVSDSCRAWRDTTLLKCFGSEPPIRLLMTIHPELWLDGSIVDRMKYIDQVMMENGTRQARRYIDEDVRQIWTTHPQARMHDERESQQSSSN